MTTPTDEQLDEMGRVTAIALERIAEFAGGLEWLGDKAAKRRRDVKRQRMQALRRIERTGGPE